MTNMIEIIKYTSKMKNEWDDFVSHSKNGTFLFYRDYMEYHSDRFEDYSLIIYAKNKLVALFPANIVEDTVYSHQGLTFGGLILEQKYHYSQIQTYYNTLLKFLQNAGILHLSIKIPPYFYSEHLAQEQRLMLQRNNIPEKTVLGASIYTKNFTFPKRCVRTNKLELYTINDDQDLSAYWQMLEENLKERHNSKPAHTLEEISRLYASFPENIKLLSLINKSNGKTEAGALIYHTDRIAKVQYFATSASGRENRVSDVLYYTIINEFKDHCEFIDFGTCEEGDNGINVQLLETKEKFGANSFPIQTFQIGCNVQLNI